jgi:hypothetical protein
MADHKHVSVVDHGVEGGDISDMKRSGISPAQMLHIYKSVTLPMLSS